MSLVDDGPFPGDCRRAIIVPVKRRIYHNAFRNKRGGVPRIEFPGNNGAIPMIRIEGVVPNEIPRNCAGVWVENGFIWVKP